uniref:Uncharacterized protein n=1 Tax=Prolemur simus TaxID=1328070 RepID=A0A8C8Z7C1_PROSS
NSFAEVSIQSLCCAKKKLTKEPFHWHVDGRWSLNGHRPRTVSAWPRVVPVQSGTAFMVGTVLVLAGPDPWAELPGTYDTAPPISPSFSLNKNVRPAGSSPRCLHLRTCVPVF